MKIKRWWEKQELIAMIPSFEEYAAKYLASLPPKPTPQTELAKLREELAALKAKQAEAPPAPPAEPPT
jgi:hypothetical protein